MKTLLVVWFVYSSTWFKVGHSGLTVQVFQSREACEAAGEVIRRDLLAGELKMDKLAISCTKL